ncbi:hypothetical protein KC318_g14720 [Hortaea werneckii]|nr:hypothetical protein KC334_g14983 [Hortaea werneckii]KAI7004867.1 hypothetical protein KC355_g8498 [Hortaea werneckii]KAI7199256.1 hypothetical protein KC324_g3349 [Hortaea werneckii]KAI7595294.1 hypothetical protein KC316_g630 [Hortaea werneckii]KAI7652726.1 hypothetical protein KC318_g14720 [Hortaea werneckii]
MAFVRRRIYNTVQPGTDSAAQAPPNHVATYNDSTVPPPKKRGRPRKDAHQPTGANGNVSAYTEYESEQAKKKKQQQDKQLVTEKTHKKSYKEIFTTNLPAL